MTANSTTKTGFYASRPVLRVAKQISADLGDVQLLNLLVEETTQGLFRCEANFTNWGPKNNTADFLYFERDLIDFGKEFAVEFGPPGMSQSVFQGRIMAIEAHYPPERPPEITVLAEDQFQDLRMTRRTRTFQNVTDADVVQQIASKQGLKAAVDLDGPSYTTLTQLNQSDLAFLRERMAAVDGELWLERGTLHAQARSRRNAGVVPLTYGSSLLEFSVLADLAHQRTSIKVSGWDVNGKQAIDVLASESAITSELNGGRSGSAVLAQALKQRDERIVSSIPLSQAEAQSVAQARYRERARRFVRGTGVADGDPRIRVGATVDLTGLGKMFDGKYYVTLARHTFDSNGYRTFFEAERPGIGG